MDCVQPCCRFPQAAMLPSSVATPPPGLDPDRVHLCHWTGWFPPESGLWEGQSGPDASRAGWGKRQQGCPQSKGGSAPDVPRRPPGITADPGTRQSAGGRNSGSNPNAGDAPRSFSWQWQGRTQALSRGISGGRQGIVQPPLASGLRPMPAMFVSRCSSLGNGVMVKVDWRCLPQSCGKIHRPGCLLKRGPTPSRSMHSHCPWRSPRRSSGWLHRS